MLKLIWKGTNFCQRSVFLETIFFVKYEKWEEVVDSLPMWMQFSGREGQLVFLLKNHGSCNLVFAVFSEKSRFFSKMSYDFYLFSLLKL